MIKSVIDGAFVFIEIIDKRFIFRIEQKFYKKILIESSSYCLLKDEYV